MPHKRKQEPFIDRKMLAIKAWGREKMPTLVKGIDIVGQKLEPPKLCWMCGKKLKRGKLCRRCFNKYASPDPEGSTYFNTPLKR